MHWLRWHLASRFPSLAALLPRRMLSVVPLEYRCNSTFIRNLALAAGLLLCLAMPSRADWHHFPVGVPYVYTIADDSTGQRLFLSASDAGLWMSLNGGAIWIPISSRLVPGGRTNVFSIEAVDAQADTLLAQTRRQWYDRPVNVYSLNGGTTWQSFTDDSVRTTGQVAVWRGGHNVWFHYKTDYTGGSFRWSTDAGQTWPDENSTPLPNVYSYKFYQDPACDSTLWFACNYELNNPEQDTTGGLLRSDDLGRSWRGLLNYHQLFGASFAETRDLLRLSNGTLTVTAYVQGTAISGETILTSSDNGETWVRMLSFPDSLWPLQIVEDTPHAGRLFVTVGGPPSIMRSDNFGQTWGEMPGLPDVQSFVEIEQNPFSGCLYLHSGRIGGFRSTDHGDNWQPLNTLPVGSDWCQFTVTPQATFVHADGGEGGWSKDWKYQPPVPGWQELQLPDSNIDTGPIILSRGDTLYALANEYNGDGSDGRMLRSTDSGVSWSRLPLAPCSFDDNLYSVRTTDSTTRILAAGWSNRIASTTDFGQSWQALAPFTNSSWLYHISQTDNGIYVLGMAGGRTVIYRSTDAGQTWEALQPNVLEAVNAAVVGDDIFADTPGLCQHWSNNAWDFRPQLPFGGPYSSVDWEMIGTSDNPMQLVAMRTDSTALWISEDMAFTWMRRDIEFPFADQNVRLSNLTYDEPRQRLWVSAGIGVCYVDMDELNAPGPLHFKPADFTVLSAYPNPFNSTTRIRFDLLQTAKVQIEVFDLQGRLIQTLVDGMEQSGRHEISFDGSALASGTYFARLQSPANTKAQKVLLLK